MSKYRKAIVALVGVAVSLGLVDSDTGKEIVQAATAVLVFLIPND